MKALLDRKGTVSIGVAVLVAAAGSIAYVRHPAGSSLATSTGEAPVDTIVPWCAPTLEAIAGGGCWSAPKDRDDAPVIVYLHGRYDSAQPGQELERQALLAKHAIAKGYAVLALRGEVGACLQPELATWYCWPSNERTQVRGQEFVDRWTIALDEVKKRTRSKKRFVLGFSNGAYFSGLLATRKLFDATAFVVASGGPVEPIHKIEGAPPILVLVGDEDGALEETLKLQADLVREGWPHDAYARAGGHFLADEDIEASLAFFSRVEKETLPLSPPLSAHRPHPRAPAEDDSTDHGNSKAPESDE